MKAMPDGLPRAAVLVRRSLPDPRRILKRLKGVAAWSAIACAVAAGCYGMFLLMKETHRAIIAIRLAEWEEFVQECGDRGGDMAYRVVDYPRDPIMECRSGQELVYSRRVKRIF